MATNTQKTKIDESISDEELFEEAEKEAAKSPDVVEVELSRPLKYEGKKITALTFDFGRLTGADGIAIENELARMGITVFLPAATIDYIVRASARACEPKIGIDAFDQMTLKDFNNIRNKARNFLMKSL